jgi:hypothetical protein
LNCGELITCAIIYPGVIYISLYYEATDTTHPHTHTQTYIFMELKRVTYILFIFYVIC